jgi:hypothetical protein
MSVELFVPQFIEFDPPEDMQRLIHSIMLSDEMKNVFVLLKAAALSGVDVDAFISRIGDLKVILSDECDRKKKQVFGQTWKNGSLISIEVSRRFWDYFHRTNNTVVGFLFAVTVVHEITHAFVRSGGFIETPPKIRTSLKIQDSGYLAERLLFPLLHFGNFGLELYGSSQVHCKWFPPKATLERCRLGTYVKKRRIWELLRQEYIEELFATGEFRVISPDDVEVTDTPPGNVCIAGRIDEEANMKEIHSKDVEITDIPPGNVVIKSNCGCVVDDGYGSD